MKIPLIALIVFLVVSCGENKPPKTTSSSSASASQDQSSSPHPFSNHDLIVNRQQLISPQGIGQAKLGMKLGELKSVLAADTELQVISPLIVDFDAIAIQKEKQLQYYILYSAGTSMSDKETIQALATNNSNYQTAEGVGPQITIKEAEAIYAEATLSSHG